MSGCRPEKQALLRSISKATDLIAEAVWANPSSSLQPAPEAVLAAFRQAGLDPETMGLMLGDGSLNRVALLEFNVLALRKVIAELLDRLGA